MKKKINLAKAPAQIELEKDEKLDKINIQSLSTTKTFFTIFFIITSTIYIILGVALIVTATESAGHFTTTNSLQIIYGIILMVVGPFSQLFLALFVNLFVSMAYDTKIIKYTLLYTKENNSDSNLKIPEEYDPAN